MGIASDLIYIVLAALAGGLLAHSLKQPLAIGYMLAGVLLGPHTGGITIKEIHDIEMLAEIGVALLLFTLGLEFSLGELRRIAKIAFLGTPLQLTLTAVGSYWIAFGLGMAWRDALWIGCIVSLSSTMIVMKSLSSQNALGTTAGRIMLGILIAQDLAVIPMMIVLPQITSDTPNLLLIGLAVLKSFVFLVVMYFIGTKFFPRLFTVIAQWGSRELFFLSVLSVALGIGLLTYSLGLSFAFGAFVAGMLLSE